MLTPQRIQDLADPIESVYINMVNELMVNIGRHITKPNWTHTAAWEIQKLSELGQLTQENAAIINRWIKQLPEEIRETMEATRRAALESIEAQMEQAAAQGYVTPPARDSTIRVMEEYAAQAADSLNLVNTTMLQSSVEQYQRAVMLTAQEAERLEAQRAATQTILNEAAGNVATGVETRNVAMRRAIKRISDEGLTGFVDRAGRHWTPEAYVNMDIRTTVHNTAIQSVRARMEDFGTDVFQVSSHAGARPGCYPYQGKFYSWNNGTGSVQLGNGSVVDYEPLNTTTYGEPAGLFGINCGHYPIPIVPGVTIPHGADNIQPPEENAKAYAESQEQRDLERQIREAKRVVEMAGDAATPEDKARVRELQKKMREFIETTGRTRRYDREQIGGTPRTRKATENVAPQATQPVPEPVKLVYEPQSSIKDAEAFARDKVGVPNVNYSGLDLRVANAMNESLTNAFNYTGKIKDRMQFYGSAQARNRELKKEVEAYYTREFQNSGFTAKAAEARAKRYASAIVGKVSGTTYAIAYSGELSGGGVTPELQAIVKKWAGIGVNANKANDFDAMTKSVEWDVSVGWHPQGTASVRSIFDHEFGHQLDYAYALRSLPDLQQYYFGQTQTDRATGLSQYGSKSIAEYIAEGYAEYVGSKTPREAARYIGRIIDREATANG